MSTEPHALHNFAMEVQQQVMIRTAAEEEGAFQKAIFTQYMIEALADAGEIEDAEVCLHYATGIEVSGYALSENGESLDLLIAIHKNCVPPETVLKADAAAAFNRAMKFFDRSRQGYHAEIEESGAAFDAAQQIYHAAKDGLTQVRFILITDGIVKNPPPTDRDLPGFRANFEIWDIERLHRFSMSGKQRETIEIDFEQTIGAAIPCLAQPDSTPGYAAYLAIFPANAIVELYGKYGARLLERNVRSFLQARGKVNAGMRETIRNSPQMFLAFNNGLSATAEAVTLSDLPQGGKGIKAIRDLQIVNGGQTTASIFNTVKKDKADVSKLFVQVKLTVLNDPEQMDTVVPLISRYANSQNQVSEADLAANDAYHRKVESMSRTVWAPAKDGTLRQTRWFYERARAQYQDERARAGTPAKIREFDAIHPKPQWFTKTDLAKAAVTWYGRPDIVSKGAQACFVWFMGHLEDLQKADGEMDARGYERLVAKLILFRSAERLIKQKEMAFTGYWANLITYTVARLVHETSSTIDLGRIWKEQKISPVLEGAVQELSRYVWSHINEPFGGGNITQFCKQQRCWTGFLDRPAYVSEAVKAETLLGSHRAAPRGHATPQNISALENVQRVTQVNAEQWFAIHTWATETSALSNFQLSAILDLAASANSGVAPTTRKANEAAKILDAVAVGGYKPS